MRKNPLFWSLVPLLLVCVACVPSAKKGKTLATFEGGSVTEGEFREAMDNLPVRVRSVALRQRSEFMESYITEKLLFQEAEKKGVQHLTDVQDLLKQARRKILVAKLIEQEVESKVNTTPEEVKTYYDNHKEEFMNPYRVRAFHILLRSREDAEAVKARLAGGEDFQEVAKQVSLDPTATKGGDLGYFQKGQLIPEIEEAAFALSPGDISDIIQTSFGFHILKVTELAQPQPKDFVSVENDINDKLVVEQKSRHFAELTDRLKRKAKISIDEKALAEVGLSEGSGSVSVSNPAS